MFKLRDNFRYVGEYMFILSTPPPCKRPKDFPMTKQKRNSKMKCDRKI